MNGICLCKRLGGENQSDEHRVNPPDANAWAMKLRMSNKSDNEQIRIFCQSAEQVFIEEDFVHGQRSFPT